MPLQKTLKILGYLVLGLIVFFVALEIFQAPKFEAVVNVVEGESKVGINPTTERLDFGDLSRGSTAVRFVDLKNESGFKTWMYVRKTGELAELLEVSEGEFSLTPGQEKRLEFSLRIPASAESRVYTASVRIWRLPQPL